MSVSLASYFTPTLFGVVPILPTLSHLFWLLPAIIVAASATFWGMIRWRNGRLLAAVLWRLKWQLTLCVVLAAVLGTLGGFAYQFLQPRSMGPVSEGQAWVMARGGLRREGSLSGRAPTNGEVIWNLRRGSEAFFASPAIVGDRLYTVGSRGNTGRIYCLDAQKGEILWSCSPPGYAATFSSPVIAHDRLVVGEGLHQTQAGRVVCLDLREGHEGRVLWMFRTASHVECTPIIDGDRVYVNAGDDGMYCLSLSPAQPQGEVIWHVPGNMLPDAETALALDDGIVYTGLGVGGEAICALDAATGEIRCRRKLPHPVFSLPAIVAGRLYVGMGSGDVVTPNAQAAGQLACFELPSLEPIWSQPLPATVMGAITATDDGVIFGCGNGHVYRFDHRGRLVAQYATQAPIVGSVAVTKRYCYLVNQSGGLWCLKLPSLLPCWTKSLGASGHYTSSPVIAHGHLYVGTDHEGVFCLGNEARKFWSSPRGGPGAIGGPHDSHVGDKGQVKEVITLKGKVKPLAAIDDYLLVASETERAAAVTCLKIQGDGQRSRTVQQWQEQHRGGNILACAVVECQPAEPQCFVLVRKTTTCVELHCLGLHTGKHCWVDKLHGTASDWLSTDGESLFVQPVADTLRCLAFDGQTKWERNIGSVTHALAHDEARIALATSDPDAVYLLDKVTGQELWRASLATTPVSAPVMQGEFLAVGTNRSLTLRSLIDGSLLWQSADSQGGVASEIGVTDEHLFWRTTKSRLVGLQVQRQQPSMDVEWGVEVTDMIRADDGMLLVSQGQLQKVSRQSSTTTVWSALPTDMVPCGAGLLQNGRVWLGTLDGRLICLGSEAIR